MAATANELYEKYRRYVKENPDKVSQLEAAARVISYLIPGNIQVDFTETGNASFIRVYSICGHR